MLFDINAIAISLGAIIPKVFYLLSMCILSVIDVFQLLVRKLAGLDCYYVGTDADATAQTGDIVSQFITGIFTGTYPILSTVFWGLLILAFVLLFLSTLIAIIRNEYTTEKDGNSKGKIVGKAFKSIIYFAIIPIVCIFGMYLANIVLVAIDGATTYNTNYVDSPLDKSKLQAVNVSTQTMGSNEKVQQTYVTYNLFGFMPDGKPIGTTNTTFSGTIFKASAYNANRVRLSANSEEDKNFYNLLEDEEVTDCNGLFAPGSDTNEKLAQKIDIAFADNVVFVKEVKLDYSNQYVESYTCSTGDPFWLQKEDSHVTANRYNVTLVWYYYDLWHFNFIIALGAGVVLATIFVNIIFGLMRRIINLVALFVAASPVIALMPLDEEKAYKSWRGEFLKNAMMAYGAIGGMNLILLVLPELQKIKFFNIAPLDWIVDTLLVIVGVLAVKDFIGIVSGWAQGADANKEGEKVAKDVASTAGKAISMAASVGGVAVGAAKVAGKGIGLMAKGAGNVAGRIAKGVGGVKNPFYKKYVKDEKELYGKTAQKNAEEAAKNAYINEKYSDVKDAAVEKVGGEEIFNTMSKKQQHKAIMEAGEQLFKKEDKESLNIKGKTYNEFVKDEINKDVEAYAKDNLTRDNFIAERTNIGRWKAEHKKRKKESQDLHEEIKLGEGGWAAVKDNVGRRFGGWVASGVNRTVEFAQPVIKPTVNLAADVGSVFTSNEFVKGFAPDGASKYAEDIGYRVMEGTTAKSVDKQKEKEKASEQTALLSNILKELQRGNNSKK